MTSSWRVWIDGRLGRGDEPLLRPTDRGLHYGDGVFETLRIERRKALMLHPHLERLSRGLAALGIDVPDAAMRASEGLGAVIEALDTDGALVAKIIVTRGSGPAGHGTRGEFQPSVIVMARPDQWRRPDAFSLITSTVIRNERSPLAAVKSLNYGDMVLARSEAEISGADEALVLNTFGRVAEATAANFFAVEGNRAITPPVSEGCLPGVVRQALIEIAAEAGVQIEERPIPPELLKTVRAAFVTNSRIGVVPVCALDGRPLPTDDASTCALAAAYRAHELESGEEL